MSKKEQILKEAEDRVRVGGYSNVSFRDLATAVGIKSASVHYHFPTKSDLGVALVQRYSDNFIGALGDATSLVEQGIDPFKHFTTLFRHALKIDQKMCLCGLLGAELEALPIEVQQETKIFFEKNIKWLVNGYMLTHGVTAEQAHQQAVKHVATLEGALLISRTLGDHEIFEEIASAH